MSKPMAYKSEYTPKWKCPNWTQSVNSLWPPLFSRTALTLLGMEFTSASHVASGVLFHSSMKTSQSWWMLETLRSSSFRLRMPHIRSIGFRSGDMFGKSITFTLSFFSKAVVVLEVCLGSLSCWNTALRPSPKGGDELIRIKIMNCSSAVPAALMQPHTMTLPPPMLDCRQDTLVFVLSWSHQTTGHGSSNPCL